MANMKRIKGIGLKSIFVVTTVFLVAKWAKKRYKPNKSMVDTDTNLFL